MGFDDHRTGVPLAWIITSKQIVQDLIEWLKPLKEKMPIVRLVAAKFVLFFHSLCGFILSFA